MTTGSCPRLPRGGGPGARGRGHTAILTRLQLDLDGYRGCEALAKKECPTFSMPFEPPADVAFRAVELMFDNVNNDKRLKECLEGLPTSFRLPRAQVTLLRQVAQSLLMTSAPFIDAMRAIAPAWQPRALTIDPALVAEACRRP
jgi:hypothetical protein